MKKLPKIVRDDAWLKPFADKIIYRREKALTREKELTGQNKSLKDFAIGHLFFGLHKTATGWVFREWAPNATDIFLTGTFNNWASDNEKYHLQKVENGVWEIHLPAQSLRHEDLYKMIVHWPGGKGERLPAWVRRVVQDDRTKIFSAQVWDPAESYIWKIKDFVRKPDPSLVYEAHIGMATEDFKVGSYNEFRLNVLPRIIKSGYNTIQLMAIQEHPYYGSFGYHVSSFFAASSRFGTPEDLKALIDDAHQVGLAVIMDLVHSHAVKNEVEGIGRLDGTPYQYFHDGPRREHVAWDSLCFNYGKNEVMHFLLSNCAFWLGEYHFDGFRMDGITSMLYLHHGLSRDFTNLGMYYDDQEDEDAIVYLMLANRLIHEMRPDAVTVAEEMSGMPGLATPFEEGGYGFDYRLAMGTPDYWIKIIKELPDEKWNVNSIYHELTNRRADEKTIGYAESHDQALVGDKTIIFRLMDKEMYFNMAKDRQNLIIDRGMALHKMIRLITIATTGAGYLNFMGNEFGHPEWIDFPREGNNWSYKYARRQWSLMEKGFLRYHFLSDFDRDMIRVIKENKCLAEPFPYKTFAQEENQVLAFTRGGLLFIFNFNPNQSFTDYGIKSFPGKYQVVLDTDDKLFGGFGRVDHSLIYYTQSLWKLATGSENVLKIYLPTRVGLALKKIPTPRVS
jgi:1,4-alpha-glucan branching enzyme